MRPTALMLNIVPARYSTWVLNHKTVEWKPLLLFLVAADPSSCQTYDCRGLAFDG
jgi:hypothetical protein